MMEFDKYIEDVKSQLVCNATEEYMKEHVIYMFTEEEVDSELEYFRQCMISGLSPYKALLFFYDYLNNEDWRNEYA